ncbi:hypothetical protein GFK82_00070 [Candidatus Steffania adelgidicola]|nr:hypothetical protein GFK82_00070 [Candidatus Steffania adelgidicola]
MIAVLAYVFMRLIRLNKRIIVDKKVCIGVELFLFNYEKILIEIACFLTW